MIFKCRNHFGCRGGWVLRRPFVLSADDDADVGPVHHVCGVRLHGQEVQRHHRACKRGVPRNQDLAADSQVRHRSSFSGWVRNTELYNSSNTYNAVCEMCVCAREGVCVCVFVAAADLVRGVLGFGGMCVCVCVVFTRIFCINTHLSENSISAYILHTPGKLHSSYIFPRYFCCVRIYIWTGFALGAKCTPPQLSVGKYRSGIAPVHCRCPRCSQAICLKTDPQTQACVGTRNEFGGLNRLSAQN